MGRSSAILRWKLAVYGSRIRSKPEQSTKLHQIAVPSGRPVDARRRFAPLFRAAHLKRMRLPPSASRALPPSVHGYNRF